MASEFETFGRQLRELVDGFLGNSTTGEARKISPTLLAEPTERPMKPLANRWGRLVETRGLQELFAGELAPKKHVRGRHPPAGIDNMRLKTVDVFRIPEMGEFTVPFEGYFQVARSEPSTDDWATATVYVNFTDLKLFGTHPELGDVMVDLNPDVVSAGNTFPAREVAGQAGKVACRINVAARFHVEKLGQVLFNKTPIQLANDDVQGIPTIGEGGKANVNSLPVYKMSDPNGELFGYIEELEYTVLNYASRDDTMRFRTATSFRKFREMAADLGPT